MNRIIALIFSFLLGTICFSVTAQKYNYEIKEKINTNIAAIEDIDFNGENFAILTKNEIYSVNQEGKIMNKKDAHGIHGISFEKKDKLLTLNMYDFPEHEGNDSNEISSLHFLAGKTPNLYTCRLIKKNGQLSYSSMIIKQKKKENYFQYIVGIPSGLYSNGETLWYLYNKSIENQDGMLRKYSLKTGLLISEEAIPVKDPRGITIGIDGALYTYEPATNSIIKLLGKQ